jgi:hypothetical protein
MILRPLVPADMSAARTLLAAVFGDSPYAERVLGLLGLSAGDDPECRGLVAEAGGHLAGLSLFGLIAGTIGGGRVHVLESEAGPAPRGEDVIRARLLDHVLGLLSQQGARYVLAELPDDPWFRAMRRSLVVAGFAEDARVNDLWRDGVALLFLRRDLHPGGQASRP